MKPPDGIIGIDDRLIEPDDVPVDGLLVLCSLPLSEPREPALLTLCGQSVLLCWSLTTTDQRLTEALDAIRECGWPTTGIAGLDGSCAVQVVAQARRQGCLVVLDPAIGVRREIVSITFDSPPPEGMW